MLKFIQINKALVPYSFDIMLNNESFVFRIDYNSTGDLFTVSLKKNGETLCDGEPIIYGQPLFGDIANTGNFPNVIIVPLDESDENNAVTYDNLSETVFLYVIGDYSE